MSPFDVIIFSGIMVALSALPSSSVALIIVRAATLGTASGIAVAIGIVLGDLIFVATAMLGLFVIAETLGSLFTLAKIIGGIYLIYLGFKLLTSKINVTLASTGPEKSKGLFTSLFAGLFLTLGDVKAIFFYASIFPMFIGSSTINAQIITTIFAITALSVGSVKVAYAVFGAKLSRHLLQSKYAEKSNYFAGGILVIIGSYVAFKA